MTELKFCEKYCPDWDVRIAEFQSLEKSGAEFDYLLGLQDAIFTSALSNYTALVCERQRKICADSAKIGWDGWKEWWIENDSILNAPQPNIEDEV